MSDGIDILLVDDDPDEVDVALRALERGGLDVGVAVARDGQEALEVLGLEPNDDVSCRPRVVFLDLKMPRLDGWEVLRRMRAHPMTASVPVVVLSRSDRIQDIERGYALGANSVLVKHFDPRGPAAYFLEAVRYWIELNRVPSGGSRERE